MKHSDLTMIVNQLLLQPLPPGQLNQLLRQFQLQDEREQLNYLTIKQFTLSLIMCNAKM